MVLARCGRAGATSSWVEVERSEVRRARRRVAGLTALIITVLVTLVGGVSYAMMVRAQEDQVLRELRYSAEHGQPSSSLPGRTWLFAPGVATGSGAPAGFPLRGDLDRVRESRTAVERRVERDGTAYLVRTQPRAGDTIQAVFDLRDQLANRRHLLEALVGAEVLGLLAAVVTGFVVGHRAVAPLAEALARERRFVTDASHELRTPITQAYTRVQLLVRRAAAADLPADHRAGLDRVAVAVRRLGEVIDDVLRSARLAAGPTVGPQVDLAALAEGAVAAETERLGELRITVTVDRPSDPLLVDGIDSALRRAVGELLANAVAHTPPGGRIALTVTRSPSDGLVELTVSDTGDGFDPGRADHIFDRFHRGQEPLAGNNSNGERSGLGLALLREVVTSHRGTVEAVGDPGHGARFTIRLPESRPPTSPGPAPVSP
jgi:two-component system, OmpR family, sensor kinase